MNIRGMFLHMIGDALGSIGVLISAFIIEWGRFSWRFYFDPICSLLVCFLILRGAIPLALESAKILLLGCPSSVNPRHIIKQIELVSHPVVVIVMISFFLFALFLRYFQLHFFFLFLQLPGISSVHAFHMWELITGKVFASLHVSITDDTNFISAQSFLSSSIYLSSSIPLGDIKKILHDNGIHYSTIQPEFQGDSVCCSLFYMFYNTAVVYVHT